MTPKSKREALRAAGKHVPRSNAEVEVAYKAISDNPSNEQTEKPKAPVVTLVADNIWTYVGYGDEPPHTCNFMGRQAFVRGVPAEVTDSVILSKIGGNNSFKKGKVTPEELLENDESFREKANKQREEDVKIQIAMDRVNRG